MIVSSTDILAVVKTLEEVRKQYAGERVKLYSLMLTATAYLDITHRFLKDEAVCDHSVGICWCDYHRTATALQGSLIAVKFDKQHDFSREAFEEKAFSDYFIRGIRRNPNVPKPRIAGCLDFVPAEDVQDKATFCERDGDSYKREDVSALWHGWKLATGTSQ